MRADYNYLVSRYGLKKVVSLGKGESLDPLGTVIVDSSLATVTANIGLYLDDAYEMLMHKLSECYDSCVLKDQMDSGSMFPMFKIWHAELTINLAEYRKGDCKDCKDHCDKILEGICKGNLVSDACETQDKAIGVCVEEIDTCIPDICKDCGCESCECCPSDGAP